MCPVPRLASGTASYKVNYRLPSLARGFLPTASPSAYKGYCEGLEPENCPTQF